MVMESWVRGMAGQAGGRVAGWLGGYCGSKKLFGPAASSMDKSRQAAQTHAPSALSASYDCFHTP